MSLDELERRELVAIMNRNEVSFWFGSLVFVTKSPEDYERAFELLTKQGRAPEREDTRRTLFCRPRKVG
jgi:hypothetical protein